GKGLDRMAGDEPAGAQAELVEELDQPRDADLAGKEPARDVARRILAAIGAEPSGDRIDINAEGTEDLFHSGKVGARQRATWPGPLDALRCHQGARLIARPERRAGVAIAGAGRSEG